jgi:thiamine monophosphate synthase
LRDVTAAEDAPIDLVGFGPVFVSATKGYGVATNDTRAPRVQGPERAWIATEASARPLFPIGGIDLANIDELAEVGRAAVGSAILSSNDPAHAARVLYEALGG